MKNYYEILEVDHRASFKEIRSAFRHLSKKYHPDINQDDKFAEGYFKDVQEAYNVLKDGIKREEFDEQLRLQGIKPNQFSSFKYFIKNKFSGKNKPDTRFDDDDEQEIDFRPLIQKSSGIYYKIGAILFFSVLALGIIIYFENNIDNSPFDNQSLSYDSEPEESSSSTEDLADKLKTGRKKIIKKIPETNSLINPKSAAQKEKEIRISETDKNDTELISAIPEEKAFKVNFNENKKVEVVKPIEVVSAPPATEPKTSETEVNKVYADTEVEKKPSFTGGSSAFVKYLTENLNYPSSAKEDGITGRVLVNFIIEKDGKISNVTVAQGIGGGCDEEAVRVLKNAPTWIPGESSGEKVRVKATIPITFKLN